MNQKTSVPFEEFNDLLQTAMDKFGTKQSALMTSIGYSDSVVSAWRNKGEAPLCAKYSLLGLLSTSDDRQAQFTFDELTALFTVLQGWPIPADVRKALTRVIARNL